MHLVIIGNELTICLQAIQQSILTGYLIITYLAVVWHIFHGFVTLDHFRFYLMPSNQVVFAPFPVFSLLPRLYLFIGCLCEFWQQQRLKYFRLSEQNGNDVFQGTECPPSVMIVPQYSEPFCAESQGQAHSAASPYFMILLRLTSTYLEILLLQK